MVVFTPRQAPGPRPAVARSDAHLLDLWLFGKAALLAEWLAPAPGHQRNHHMW